MTSEAKIICDNALHACSSRLSAASVLLITASTVSAPPQCPAIIFIIKINSNVS